MGYIASLGMYGGVVQLVPLKAKNYQDAAREVYARTFCKSLDVALSEDYDGSDAAHQHLLDSIPDETVKKYFANLSQERWTDSGAINNSITMVPNDIKIFDVVGFRPVDKIVLHSDWIQFLAGKLQRADDAVKKEEIARLERQMQENQARLEELKKRK